MTRIGTPSSIDRTNLHRGRMRPQQMTAREIEGVVHGACRMVFRNVERREVVEIVFDFRTRTDTETRLAKDLLDTHPGAGNGMPSARAETAARQGNIDGIGSQPLREFFGFQGLAPGIELPLHRLLCGVDRLSRGWPLLGRQLAEPLQELSQLAFLAQVFDANAVQRGEFTRRVDLGRSRVNELVQCLHGVGRNGRVRRAPDRPGISQRLPDRFSPARRSLRKRRDRVRQCPRAPSDRYRHWRGSARGSGGCKTDRGASQLR